jgi:Tfp pilus assembly pilus retraction ATPase PilT
MKAATINEIKTELKRLPQARATELCLRMARFKKENKELLTYLLFEADDLTSYLKTIKEDIDISFAEVHRTNLYFAKKSLRKILRNINKHIKYTADKGAEAELLLHYCTNFKGLKLATNKSAALSNIYTAQLKKIEAAIGTMHEDLQHDYLIQLERLKK